MSTEAPAQPSTSSKAAAIRIFGDMMLDQYLIASPTQVLNDSVSRVACKSKGWFLGGTARLACYLGWLAKGMLSSETEPKKMWYHSRAIGTAVSEFQAVPLSFLPRGPEDLDVFFKELGLTWDRVSLKTRVMDENLWTSPLKMFSTDPELMTTKSLPLNSTARIVVFSDYQKGAITDELVKFVIHNSGAELVVYDGYDFSLARRIACDPMVKQLVIKGSYRQWASMPACPSVSEACRLIFEAADPASVLVILSDEGNPTQIHASFNGLPIESKLYPPHIAGVLPKACTNGAGDLLTAGLLYEWIKLPDLSFSSLFHTLRHSLFAAMQPVHDLLLLRQKEYNPFLEPWYRVEPFVYPVAESTSEPSISILASGE